MSEPILSETNVDARKGGGLQAIRVTYEFIQDDTVLLKRGFIADVTHGVSDAIAEISRETIRDFNPWSVRF